MDTLDTIAYERARAAKKGRPIGTVDGHRNTPRWEPKSWKPVYDQIIGLYLAGQKQTMIAESLELSSVMVNNIIHCTKGQQLIEQATARFREECLSKIPDKLNAMTIQAMENMESILKDDDVKKNSPIALFDRSMQVLQAAGKVQRPIDASKQTNIQNNTLIVPLEQAQTFLKGLAMSEKFEEQRKLASPSQ